MVALFLSYSIKPDFEQKEKDGIQLINQTIENNPDHKAVVLNSTGKDSVVTQHLCELSNYKVPVVFNNTTLDCADTYKIVNQHKNDWIVTCTDEGFYQYIKRANFIPTRFSRGCCSIFKEQATIDYFDNEKKMIFIMGVRNDESLKRADRKDIGKNPKWGNRNWFSLLPIRKWSELEIWCYILDHNLLVNPKYKKGYKRVGCSIACPYYNKSTWYLDKYWYPKQYERWHKIITDDFLKFSKWNVMNCTLEEYQICWNGGRFRDNPTDEVISEFMQYKGITDPKLAKKYFNQKCYKCGGNMVRDTIAMNLKFHGRQIDKFLCKKCLMKELNINNEEWNNYVDSFKQEGCVLF